MKMIESPLAALTSAAHSTAVAICAVLRDTFKVPADATAYVIPDAVESGESAEKLAPVVRTSLSAPKLSKNGTGKVAVGRLPIAVPASFLLPLAASPGDAAERIVAALLDAILAGSISGPASKAKRAEIGLYRDKTSKRPTFRTDVSGTFKDAFQMAARLAAPADVLKSLTPPKRLTRLQVTCPFSDSADKNAKHYSASVPTAHAVEHHGPGGLFEHCPNCAKIGKRVAFRLMIDSQTPYVIGGATAEPTDVPDSPGPEMHSDAEPVAVPA